MAISLAISFWQIANYLADNSKNLTLYWNRATFIGPMLTLLFFLFFVRYLVGKGDGRTLKALSYIGVVSFSALCMSSYVIKSISPRMSRYGVIEGYNVERGSAYIVAILFILFLIIAVASTLFMGFKNAQGKNKSRLQIVFMAFIASAVMGLVTNVLLPLVTKSTELSKFAPITSVILVGILSFAILKHRLFDIRSVVVRSLVYAFVLTFLTASFTLIALPLTSLVIPRNYSQNQLIAIYGIIAVVLAMALQPIKKFFDRVTNRIFYRDAYETQEVLDKVSGVIVGNVDAHKVQKGALLALVEALRPTYGAFLLTHNNGDMRLGDVVGENWEVKSQSTLKTVLKSAGKKIILFDELEEQKSKLKEVLRAEDISVVSPLVTKNELIGYLILGPKKSGNIYNSQDVGLLNIASNELAVALQNAQRFEEIQAFNLTLQEKVTEATRELKLTNRKLVALDEAKDEFISMASHQLRTPLTSIKGYLSMMSEGDLGKLKPAQARAVREAYGSSQRMVFLIADFLNVSRIKTGKFVIEPKEINLPQMVGEEITQLREMAASRELTINYGPPEKFPTVMLDDNKIRQVMMNMVDNAIYYTPSGGSVTIHLYNTADEIVFKVEDTGIGVPKQEQHKLFTKFFRAGNARKARPDGTGLGLFMAQKIIVAQGGSVIFESIEGKGSTFGFRFPLKQIKP